MNDKERLRFIWPYLIGIVICLCYVAFAPLGWMTIVFAGLALMTAFATQTIWNALKRL